MLAQSQTWISISQGSSRAAVLVERTAPYDDAPSAAIPARPLDSDAQLTATAFRIRAWKEGGSSRVVVYAVTGTRNTKAEREQILSAFLLDRGESVEVSAPERYGAAHVTLNAGER